MDGGQKKAPAEVKSCRRSSAGGAIKKDHTEREKQGQIGGQNEAPFLVYTQELLPSSNHGGSRTVEAVDKKTGEVREFETGKNGELIPKYSLLDHQNVRAERWQMKWTVDRLLWGSRQSKCHRWKLPKKALEVKLSEKYKKAFYAGFESCGSVWACPLCAPKITERRKFEVQEGIEKAKALGLGAYLVTYTVPHGMGDDPKAIRKMMSAAWMKGTSTRAGVRIRKLIGIKGTIRVTEVTYGHNGFHPHYHVLMFIDSAYDCEAIKALLYPLWLDGCRKVGLGEPSWAHGVKVDDGSKAAQYVTKWGMESELTKGHLKKGKHSINPWDLLRVHTFGLNHPGIAPELVQVFDELDIDQKRAGSLWVTFAKAFKGARQLYWSNGLRALLGLKKELSDKELAEKEMDTAAIVLATLTNEQRFDLIRTRNLPTLLNLAEDNPGSIPAFLESIKKKG
jgi:hypothetical protein